MKVAEATSRLMIENSPRIEKSENPYEKFY